ncbi:uncharacterized protein LOC135498436 [Lineus longissimus]|uniref:uncharacterized protein LOC135498436 n=1 Tax=Lineus longissimus TaxID=88925 RepID=UPI002B4CD66C
MTIFQCDTCPKTFLTSRDLRRHILTHTGEKPLKCELCDKRFARPDYLKLHARRMHSDDTDGARPAMTVGSVGAQQGTSAAPKRSRLSLKKSSGKKQGDQATPKKEETPTKTEPVEETKAETVEHVEIPDHVNEPRPAIASFGNLGNTCFLNSVLQVLRYTPGFVPNVGYLSKELLSAHREKLAGSENDSDDVEVSSQWRLVRSLSKLFIKMNKAEESFEEDSDPYDLVMHPSKLLDIVREMNPMFEGNLQHDAQEMLRCLLCYIQDATHELTKFRTEPQGGTEKSPEKMKDSSAPDSGVKTLDLNDVVDLNEDVDMSKDCNFNYDLKHLTPAKAEVQMRGGARPKAKSSATTTRRKGKVESRLDKVSVCENDADSDGNGADRLKNSVHNEANRLKNANGVENGVDRLENGVENGASRLKNGVENDEVVNQINGKRGKHSKLRKSSETVEAVKVTNGTGGRRKRETTCRKESATVSPLRGRSRTSKSGPEDADVESRPVDETVLENLGEQTNVLVSVDEEGSITLSPRKDTTILLSPGKNGLVTMSVQQTATLPENSNSHSQFCVLNGDAEKSPKKFAALRDTKTSRGKRKNKNCQSNLFESFVVEKTESLKYNYVPTVKREMVNGIGSGDRKIKAETDEELGLKWSVNKTAKTYSKKSANTEQTSTTAPLVSEKGCGDADEQKNNDLDWLKPVEPSPPDISSFADAFSNFLKQDSNSKSKSTASPKKRLPTEAASSVKSEKCLGPLSCEIPLTTSVMCPNGVSPKLPASLSPTVTLSQLENKGINSNTKRNLSAKFAGCNDDRLSQQDGNLASVFGDDRLNSATDACLDTKNAQSNVIGSETTDNSIKSDVVNSPGKPENDSSTNLPVHLSAAAAVHPHLVDNQIGSVLPSPKETATDSTSGPVVSPLPKLQVINKKVASPSVIVCQVHSPEKKLVKEKKASGVGSPSCTAMDTTSPKHLHESLRSPDKNTTDDLDQVTDMQSSTDGKNSSSAGDDLHNSEGQGMSSTIQHPRSNKRVLFDTCDEIVTESAPKRQRHGVERGQTNLFTHFGKKRTMRRLGMRGGVVVKDEMDSEPQVSPPIVSLNGHSLGAPISNVASGLLDEEFDKRDASGTVTYDNVDYSYNFISPMKQPVTLDKSPNLTPIKPSSLEEDCTISKVRKSLDFNGSLLTPAAEDESCPKPGDKVEIEPMETILMADLVKDAMSLNRKAVVCLEKCDSVQKKTGKRLIDSEYDELRVKVVENMFQGMVVLKTRCLECECCTARKEDFQDVSIPVPSRKSNAIAEGEPGEVDAAGDGADADAPSDDEDFPDVTTSDWMLSAMAEVEQLREENKYYCDQCCRLVEAQRFMQYEMMPDILTFHVKRFAACMSILGGVSKLTDHIATPFSLPCFKATCPKPCQASSHSYSLYGIIMHSGLTITAGHYTAYVKVPSDLATMNKKPRDQHVPDLYESPGLVRLEELTNQWLECDDDIIKPLSAEELQSSLGEADTCATPYVLFYRRNN